MNVNTGVLALAVGTNMQAFYDGMTVVGSLVIMVAVIAATYYLSRWYAGKMGRSVSGRHVKVVDRVILGPGSAVCILEAGGKYYLVGVSDKNIQLICELEGFEPGSPEESGRQASFGSILKGFLVKGGAADNKGDGVGS